MKCALKVLGLHFSGTTMAVGLSGARRPCDGIFTTDISERPCVDSGSRVESIDDVLALGPGFIIMRDERRPYFRPV